MNKLLFSNFSRLLKSKLFWGCVIFNFCFAYLLCTDRNGLNMLSGDSIPLDSVFFTYAFTMMIIIPLFNSLFIGTEYSDGTIRNKIIIGHSRFSIYMANFIVCVLANILISLAFILSCIVFGMPMLGFFQTPINHILYLIFCTFISVIAMTALVTAIAMINKYKATSTVICIVLALLLLTTTSIIDERLQGPEMQTSGFIDSSGELQLSAPIHYVSGTKQTVYEFLDDFIPTGQAIQVSNLDTERSYRWWYLSLILTLFSVGSGYIFFRRKDIR